MPTTTTTTTSSTTIPVVDWPIAGERLIVERKPSGKERLLFRSRDPGFAFPPIGSADDPSSGAPGDLVVELFSPVAGRATLAVPPGVGSPGWTVRDRATDAYPVPQPRGPRGTVHRTGRGAARGPHARGDRRVDGVRAPVAHGRLGIRIRAGTRRSCAPFAPPSVVTNEPGRFVA